MNIQTKSIQLIQAAIRGYLMRKMLQQIWREYTTVFNDQTCIQSLATQNIQSQKPKIEIKYLSQNPYDIAFIQNDIQSKLLLQPKPDSIQKIIQNPPSASISSQIQYLLSYPIKVK